jgi:hypothetical protein
VTESKARVLLRDWVASGRLPSLPDEAAARALAAAAREQGLSGLLLSAFERERPAAVEPLLPALSAERRAALARTLGQIALAHQVLGLLEGRGIRALPLKGSVLAETVYDVECDRPMSDVDVLALERWPDGLAALREAGFTELARGDHAWAFTAPGTGGVVELHRSVVSAPGLFPLDRDGVWARSRTGPRQLRRLPSPEDLLLQLALHASFQHGLVLSLVQWLDFRRVLEREALDPESLRDRAKAARAEAPLAAALAVAEAVVGAPLPTALGVALAAGMPRGLRLFLERRLADPLSSFVAPAEPDLARVRWELLAGRRAELLWRTLVLPETPEGDERLAARLRAAGSRALRLARRPRPTAAAPPDDVHDLGEPPLARSEAPGPPTAESVEVPFAEELLRECLDSFPHVRLTVTGRCMEPALAHGEKVRLVGAARRRPRLGDVVLARHRDGLRLHRLVWGPPLAPPGTAWRTKADRGLLLDPPLGAADVLATVLRIEDRPSVRPRRAARALASLARALAARLRLPRGASGAEVLP